MSSKRPILLASIAVLTALALLLAADAVARTRTQHALAASAGRFFGAKATDVHATVSGFSVLYQLATGHLQDVRVTASAGETRLVLELHGVAVRGDHRVQRIDANATVPWDAVNSAASSSANGVPQPQFADVDGHLEAIIQRGAGSIGIDYRLTHTATTLTFTPQSLIVGGLTVPIDAIQELAQPGARTLTEPHTITPKLPAGVTISAASYSAGGLRLTLNIPQPCAGKPRRHELSTSICKKRGRLLCGRSSALGALGSGSFPNAGPAGYSIRMGHEVAGPICSRCLLEMWPETSAPLAATWRCPVCGVRFPQPQSDRPAWLQPRTERR